MKLFQFELSKNFDKNRQAAGKKGLGGETFCVVCGKAMSNYNACPMVHLVAGGNYALHPSDEGTYKTDGGDLGFWSVGPECRKMFGDYLYTERQFENAILMAGKEGKK